MLLHAGQLIQWHLTEGVVLLQKGRLIILSLIYVYIELIILHKFCTLFPKVKNKFFGIVHKQINPHQLSHFLPLPNL